MEAQLGQLLRHHFNLVGRVGFTGAVEQANFLGFREQLLDHRRLLIQRGQIGGTGDVGTRLAVHTGQIQRHAVIRHRRAQNRDIARSALRRLQRAGSVGHDQVNIIRHESIHDLHASSSLASRVLFIKYNLIAQLFGQEIAEALGGRVQRRMGSQLANADAIGFFLRQSRAQTRQQQTDSHQNRAYLFHCGFLLKILIKKRPPSEREPLIELIPAMPEQPQTLRFRRAF